MQMFGVGALELLVILILAVIVVGPDRLPQVASDLGRWIRQTRAYARHLMGDFNEVVSELKKEAGASSEDWKEVASVFTRHTGAVGQELSRFGRDVEDSGDLSEAKKDESALPAPASNGANEAEDDAGDGKSDLAAISNGTNGDKPATEEPTGTDGEPEEEKPWYEPERASRRRSNE